MQIKKEYKFYAGHRNQDLDDKCFRPHGHDYKLFVVFNVRRTGSISTLFGDFDAKIEPWLKNNMDHRFLIDKKDPLYAYFELYEEEQKKSLGIKVLPYPSSVENLCHFLFEEFTEVMGFDVERIELQETRTSTVIYDKVDYKLDKEVYKLNS